MKYLDYREDETRGTISHVLRRGYDVVDGVTRAQDATLRDGVLGDHSRDARERYIYNFDGVDDYVNYSYGQAFPNHVTIAVRCKTANTKAVQFIAGHGDTGAKGYWLGITGGSARFSCGNGTVNTQLPSNVNIADGKRHMIVGTYDGTIQSIFVDGIKKGASTTVNGNLNYSGLAVGLQRANVHGMHPSRYRHGQQAEMMVWNRALTENEVTGLSNGTIPTSGLIIYDPADVGHGTKAYNVARTNPLEFSQSHGAIHNATLTSFHIVDNSIPSYVNKHGYNRGMGANTRVINNKRQEPVDSTAGRTAGSNVTITPIFNGGFASGVKFKGGGPITSTANNRFRQNNVFPNIATDTYYAQMRVRRVSGTGKLHLGCAYGHDPAQDKTITGTARQTVTWTVRRAGLNWYDATQSKILTIGTDVAGDEFEIDWIQIGTVDDIVPNRFSDPSVDANGQPTRYTGQVSYRPRLVASHCVTLDGTDDYIDLSSGGSLFAGKTTGRFACWFRRTGTSNTSTLLCLGDGSSDIGKNLWIMLGGTTSSYNDDSMCVYVQRHMWMYIRRGETRLRDGKPHHLEVIVDGVDNRILIDGERQVITFARGSKTTAQRTNVPSSTTLLAGVRQYGSGRNAYHKGSVRGIELTEADGTPILTVPCAEGSGVRTYATQGHVGEIKNGTMTQLWAGTQNNYHYNILHDHSLAQNKAFRTDTTAGRSKNNTVTSTVDGPFGGKVATRLSPETTGKTLYRMYIGGQGTNPLGERIVARVKKGAGDTYTLFRYTGADVFSFDFQTGIAQQGSKCDSLTVEQKHDGWYRIVAHTTSRGNAVPQWWVGDKPLAPDAAGNTINSASCHVDIFWASTDGPQYEPVTTTGSYNAGVIRVPYGDGVKTGNRHNGAETKIQYPACPIIKAVQDQLSSPYLLNTNGTPRPIPYSEIIAQRDRLIYADILDHGKSNLRIYPTPQ